MITEEHGRVLSINRPRTEFGQEFAWNEMGGFWQYSGPACELRRVFVIHLLELKGRSGNWWLVIAPDLGAFHTLEGEDKEREAFREAAGLVERAF